MSTDNAFTMEAYDEQLSLAQLLSGVDLSKIMRDVEGLLGMPAALSDADGQVIAGDPGLLEQERVALIWELEEIGYLYAKAPREALSAAVGLLQAMVALAARYYMASQLHLEVTETDYQALERKHADLLESEARFRELSEQLEERVNEQVKTIENAQRQLYETEKLASVGQLAAGVAHEINNPIGFIKSNLGTAKGYVESFHSFAQATRSARSPADIGKAWEDADLEFLLEDFESLLQESLDGASRVSRIVSDLKDFSHEEAGGERERTDVGALVHSVCNVARTQIGGGVELSIEIQPLPKVDCVAGQISQVLFNLLLNAAQAMQGQGRITFHSGVDRHFVFLAVRDNGPGIPADIVSRIFDPFFTNKDVGQGTGLGLTVCHDVLDAHGGRIELDTQEGEGTEFRIYLPLPEARSS